MFDVTLSRNRENGSSDIPTPSPKPLCTFGERVRVIARQ